MALVSLPSAVTMVAGIERKEPHHLRRWLERGITDLTFRTVVNEESRFREQTTQRIDAIGRNHVTGDVD